jgi:hypothetical protein
MREGFNSSNTDLLLTDANNPLGRLQEEHAHHHWESERFYCIGMLGDLWYLSHEGGLARYILGNVLINSTYYSYLSFGYHNETQK